MRVLLTGHQGYLGTVMAPILTAAGHDVTGLDSGLFADCVLGAVRCEGDVPDGRARVLLRPEQLRLAAPRPDAVVARVRSVDFYGHDSRVWLALPDGGTVSARVASAA